MPIVTDEQITELLANGDIKAFTIDTSIFDQKQLRLKSATMQSLGGLKAKGLDFLLSGTVAAEVLGHLTSATAGALQAARKAIGDALFEFETKYPTRDDLLNKITLGQTPAFMADVRFQDFVRKSGAEVIKDAALVPSGLIYESYFKGFPPFGLGKKKSEFPDALALNALEQVAKDRRTGILVVSGDKDWRRFCEKSDRLYLVPKVEQALSLVTDAPIGIKEEIATWLASHAEQDASILSHLDSRVSDIVVEVNAHAVHGHVEASVWAPLFKGAYWPDPADLQIIGLVAADEPEALEVTVTTSSDLRIEFPVDLDFSTFDSIDRDTVDLGGRLEEVEKTIDTQVTLTLAVVRTPGAERIELLDLDLELRRYQLEMGEVDVYGRDDWEDREPEAE